MEHFAQLKDIGCVACAMVLGGFIGFERELAEKPAGMRTHMLVAGTAAMLVVLAGMLVGSFGGSFDPGLVRADPVRVIEAMVTGVSFLGAGTIIRREPRSLVYGLTTAASLLFTASVGISVGLKKPILAIGATALALITLRVVEKMESRFQKKKEEPK